MHTIKVQKAHSAIRVNVGCQSGELTLAEAAELRDKLDAEIKAPDPIYWWVRPASDSAWYGPYLAVRTGDHKPASTEFKNVLIVTPPNSTDGYFSVGNGTAFQIVQSVSNPTPR